MESSEELAPRLREQDVLDLIIPRIPSADAALVGPGDDCAVVASPDGRFVITSDMMVAGPDFRLAWSAPFDLGWKAAASNLADVAAMGARPTGLVVSIAAPDRSDAALFSGVADGLREACAALAPGCGVVGGDLSTSPVLTFSVTAFGDLEGRAPVLRSGALPGDVVALCGAMGRAAAGLRLLFSEGVDAEGRPDAVRAAVLRERHAGLVEAQLRPRPPVAAGVAAADAGATAMLDVSDGLALDAARIARASGVTIELHGARLGEDGEAALAGGEDHALLATFPPGRPLPAGFVPLGVVLERASGDVLLDGAPLEPGGWDPYAAWDGAGG